MKSSLSVVFKDGEVRVEGFESTSHAASFYKELVGNPVKKEKNLDTDGSPLTQIRNRPNGVRQVFSKWTEEEDRVLLNNITMKPRKLVLLLKRHSRVGISARASGFRRRRADVVGKAALARAEAYGFYQRLDAEKLKKTEDEKFVSTPTSVFNRY